ncbi:regulating synaptic membrane exocytosis protein 2 [Caerostris extrusa]|uniref:Regulating synaptic membrane exocytosis protein 2 n=1 Tax=Caerostris extrusa TaxID=172846 RepID=A0AAV4YC87_CAEEX|nr:regulating synaptic membrane exocytosis protein 2 [Caerostris extrusa]
MWLIRKLVLLGLGALVEKHHEGSVADRIGRIQPYDEVLEWNGRRFRGLFKKKKPNVPSPLDPLEGRRPPRHMEVHPEALPREIRRLPPPHLEVYPEPMHRGMLADSHSLRYSDRHSSYAPRRAPVAMIGGRMKIRLWYDPADFQLGGTVECAKDLPQRADGRPRNPYVRIFLLPDKTGKSRRRSKCIARTNNPQWNLSFVYTHLRQSELRNRTLQISVWDYEKNEKSNCNDFLGEVLIPLHSKLRSDSKWYSLTMHREEPKGNPSPPLSPGASRMSDEEELSDFDDKFSEHTERRIMAVDSSPPFYEEDRRRQSSLPFPAPAIMASPMGERSRSLTAPSPSSEYSRGRMREPGYGDRRRSAPWQILLLGICPLMALDQYLRHSTGLNFNPSPVPLSRSELEERYLRGRNPATSASAGSYNSEFDRFAVPRRGGGSRMAAALGVSASSPLVSPDRSDSESSSKFNLSSAFHRNSRTFEEFRGRSSDYGGPVHPSSREIDGSLSDTAVGLMDKAKVNVHRSTPHRQRQQEPIPLQKE